MSQENNSKPRIVHLTTVNSRTNIRIFIKMCRSLAANGYDTHVILADGKGSETRDNVHIHDLGTPKTRFHRVFFTSAKLFIKALGLNADIYHFHDPELMPWGILLRLCGKKVIYDIHEHYRDILLDAYYLPMWARKTIAFSYSIAEFVTARLINGCIVTTEYMSKTTNVTRTTIIENYVILSEFTPSKQPKENAVCCISILHESRCVIEMIDAAGLSNTPLYLAGEYYSDTLQTQAHQRPAWKNVRELGFISRTEMQSIFDRSQAGLLIVKPRLSYNHGSFNKIYEYMAAGIPIIASDFPSARTVIEKHHCGLLVNPPTEIPSIASAISWIIAHPEESHQMGERGRKAVEQHYTWENEVQKLFKLYEALLA